MGDFFSSPAPKLGRAVAVHCFSYANWRSRLTELNACLDEGEFERLRAYAFPELRERFAMTRGLLRKLLSHYLQRPADQLAFVANPWAKPALRGEELHFNLSHSRDCLWVALSRSRELGVDGEYCDPRRPMAKIIESRLKDHIHDFCELRDYWQLWCLKEAQLKCLGYGLYALERAPGFAWRPTEKDLVLPGLQLHILKTASADYVAALAVEGEAKVEVNYFEG